MTDKEKLWQVNHLEKNEPKNIQEIQEIQEASDNIYGNMTDEKQRYLDEQKKVISDITERIKELAQTKKEKEKSIPKMDSDFVERVCLIELSKVLTKDELEFVRKWNEYWRTLYEHYKATWSFKDELAKKIMDRLKTLNEDKKLVFAEYLSNKGILLFWSDYRGFFHYSDDIYSKYIEIQNNLKELWLDKCVEYVWDLCYDIDKLIIETAKEGVFDETLSQEILLIKKEIEKINEEIEQLKIEKYDITKKTKAVYHYWLPVNQAISTLEWKNSLDWNIVSEFVDDQEKVYVYLCDYSYYPWWWCWMEYWVKIFVKRWLKTDMKGIVYRDAYSSRWDDRSKAYRNIDKVKIMDDKIIVIVSSSERSDTYVFWLQKQKEEISEKCLSTAEQEKFKERITKEKERLLQENIRRYGIMSSNHDLVYMKMPWSKIYDRKYEEAKIIDESINLWEWICYLVIKTQIDANAADWMQFAWLKYEITPTSTKLVGQQTAYQSELMSGKRINIRAK